MEPLDEKVSRSVTLAERHLVSLLRGSSHILDPGDPPAHTRPVSAVWVGWAPDRSPPGRDTRRTPGYPGQWMQRNQPLQSRDRRRRPEVPQENFSWSFFF